MVTNLFLFNGVRNLYADYAACPSRGARKTDLVPSAPPGLSPRTWLLILVSAHVLRAGAT